MPLLYLALIPLLTGTAVALLFLFFTGTFREPLSERIKKHTSRDRKDETRKEARKPKKAEAGARAKKQREFARRLRYLERVMAEADIPLKAGEYLVLQAMASVIPTILIVLTRGVIPGIAWLVVSLLVPLLLLRHARGKRQVVFDRQFGESLGTMANFLRAGFSFQQAMEVVAQESSPPLATELRRTLQEIELGITLQEALEHLKSRVASTDLALVVTAVNIQQQVGGNLAEVLDSVGSTIKERARVRAEVKALTAQGRISGWIIGVLPFALAAFLLAVNPEYVMLLFKHPLGLAMITTALVGEVIGLFMISRIVRVEL